MAEVTMSNSKSEDTPRCEPGAFDGYCNEHHIPVEKCWEALKEITPPEPPQDTSLHDKATRHTHKWSHVSKAWEHCSGCDKWRSTSDAK